MYPRRCADCSSEPYKDKQSFSQHKRRGTCSKRIQLQKVQITNQININHLHIGNNDNSVNINQGLPDWIEADKIAGYVDQVKKTIALLEANGVKGLSETDRYIRKETFTYSDFVKALKEDFGTIDRVVDLTKRTVPQKAAKIAPLTLAYNFIFNNKKGSTELETLHRRPFHLNDDTGACDVLTYENDTADDCVLGWEKKIWRSLLSEILHMLGVKLYDRMKEVNYSYISSSDDEDDKEDEPIPEKEIEITYHETDEQAEKAEMKLKRERRLKEERKKKKMKARIHPYIKWWTTVVGPETLEFDPEVCKLMDTISKELIKQCKNDVRAGWHRLIDYCRALHDIGKIDTTVPLDPKLNELDHKWKDYIALQHARHDAEMSTDEDEENIKQQKYHEKEIKRLKKTGLKVTKSVRKTKPKQAILEHSHTAVLDS